MLHADDDGQFEAPCQQANLANPEGAAETTSEGSQCSADTCASSPEHRLAGEAEFAHID